MASRKKIYYALLRTDEKPVELPSEPTLEELQLLCDGYIEQIVVAAGYLLANEEGKLKNLPINHTATALYQAPILGDVVFVTENFDWFQTVVSSRYYRNKQKKENTK